MTARTHLLSAESIGLGDMCAFYSAHQIIPTSEEADVALIRSHIAYWQGSVAADRSVIKPSRGHSYRVHLNGSVHFVRIVDSYDHRDGVTGLYNRKEIS